MFKRLRWALVLGCVAILAAAYVREQIILRASGSAVEALDAAIVDRGDILIVVSATGQIRPVREYPLSFAGTGPVAIIHTREGDHVRAGQALATLDTRSLQLAVQSARLAYDRQRAAYDALVAPPRPIDIQAAEAALNTAQAQLRAANIGADPLQVRMAEVQVELARNSLWQSQLTRDQTNAQAEAQNAVAQGLTDRLWQLPPEVRDAALGLVGAIPASPAAGLGISPADAERRVQISEYDVPIAQAQLSQAQSQRGNAANVAGAQLSVASAQAALDRLRNGPEPEAVAIAEAQIEAAQAALALAEYNLERATLTAPVDGVVARLNLVEGEPAPLDRPAVLLVDDSRFILDVPIDEADIGGVAAGQPVTVSLDALPGRPLVGRVSRVAETATTLGGVVTFLVRVDVEAGGQMLRSGMTATATITTDAISDVLRVRNRYVRLDRRTGRATVIVQAPDGALREVEVVLGLRNETFSEVRAGLAEGDRVVALPRTLNLF